MISKINGGGVTAALGFIAASALGDIKGKGRKTPDVAMLVSDVPCVWAGAFTKNLVKAAPVQYGMELLNRGDKLSAVVVNAGNANACTGEKGLIACHKVAAEAARLLELDINQVITASTGVIGVELPYERILNVLPEMVENLTDDGGLDFAQAIMTTDTFSKESAVMVESGGSQYVIGGACKGAGMIAPSVATMLTFVTTDVKISKELLDKALKEVIDITFNCVTVDGDTSTNDTVILMANGMSEVTVDEKGYSEFKEALGVVCDNLAKMIAKDGEGATKLVTITVKNAKNYDDARRCAYKIANSPLVKTMFAGCDPNWGRLMASAGASGAVFDPDKTDIFFNNVHYVKNGVIIDYALEKQVYEIMKNAEYDIILDLHAGQSAAKFYTCDFTSDYVKINADYRS